MSFQNRELGSSAGRSKQGHQSAAIGKSLSFAQGTATAGRRMQRIADNDSKLQERQRKKKLLMSDSLQMLTRHRNNQLAAQMHGSIDKSLRSGTNQSSNQSKERQLASDGIEFPADHEEKKTELASH